MAALRRFDGFAGRILVWLGLATIGPSFSVATPAWQSKEVQITTQPDQKVAVATFRVKNAGAQPLQVKSMAPSCDCVALKFDRQSLGPGESGELTAEFTIGNQTGRHEQTIAVTFDDAPDRRDILRLVVVIPEFLTVEPRLIIWQKGERKDRRQITISVADPKATQIVEVRSLSDAFSVRLQPPGVAGVQLLDVQPPTSNQRAQTTIQIRTVHLGKEKTYLLYAFAE